MSDGLKILLAIFLAALIGLMWVFYSVHRDARLGCASIGMRLSDTARGYICEAPDGQLYAVPPLKGRKP